MTGPWSAHLSTLFTERAVTERPAAAAAAGFDTVETWWPGEDRDAWAAAVREAGLWVAAVNAPGLDVDAGLALAREVGARAVNVLAEGDRGECVSALRTAAPAAAAAGIALVVEHRNRHDAPACLVATPADAAALVAEAGHPAVQLLYDGYHAMRAGLDPAADVARYAGLIGHAQWADSPGRHEPGTGGGDLWRFAAALRETGYVHRIGLEWLPRAGTEKSLEALRNQPSSR